MGEDDLLAELDAVEERVYDAELKYGIAPLAVVLPLRGRLLVRKAPWLQGALHQKRPRRVRPWLQGTFGNGTAGVCVKTRPDDSLWQLSVSVLTHTDRYFYSDRARLMPVSVQRRAPFGQKRGSVCRDARNVSPKATLCSSRDGITTSRFALRECNGARAAARRTAMRRPR